MKFLHEYRDAAAVEKLVREIERTVTRPHTLMEVCGGQTHSIVKFGIDRLLPAEITLIHGPGCPVCVTPIDLIDKAIEIAARREVLFCSFGDMLRVPGSHTDLFAAKAAGADVRMVYSPLDAVRLAQAHPRREVVFFAVGFETTAPVNALAVFQAHTQGLKNFSILCAQVLVPPAMEAILASPHCRVQGFLAAGHVCTVMGYHEYEALCQRHQTPIVVTGFEPLDILEGVLLCVRQLEERRAAVENQYVRAVRREGNLAAQALVQTVFQPGARSWRGLGEIPKSGLVLRPPYDAYDAEKRFGLEGHAVAEPEACRSGDVLQGFIKPVECPAFGVLCTPERPLGAPMVSSEGACAAYYRYRREPAGAAASPRL
ncbi:MAG: hydrogenase formation protein HypD [Candidatus Hydrogenedentes bacterium]|nr:hydrogenase formation protein HypD [Candidatus Hydrogenedentota bacterium]